VPGRDAAAGAEVQHRQLVQSEICGEPCIVDVAAEKAEVIEVMHVASTPHGRRRQAARRGLEHRQARRRLQRHQTHGKTMHHAHGMWKQMSSSAPWWLCVSVKGRKKPKELPVFQQRQHQRILDHQKQQIFLDKWRLPRW